MFQPEVVFIRLSAEALQQQQTPFGFDPEQIPTAGTQLPAMFSNTVATGKPCR